MSEDLTLQSVVVAAKDQVSCNLDGEIAILSVAKGTYYGLDQIGAQVWNLLQEPRSVAHIYEAILQEYEVDPECCRRDLLALLERLWTEGLIEICVGPARHLPAKTH